MDKLLQEQQVEGDQSKEKKSSEDLAMVFFEWLKNNKESISPEDLKSIKLKRSTIECAARRLGGSKEGMMQLLKLILEWVQNHLQKKRSRGEEDNNIPSIGYNSFCHSQAPVTITNDTVNPNPNPNFSSTNPISSDPWLPHSSYLPNQTPGSFPVMGYVGDHMFSGATTSLLLNNNSDYQMVDSPVGWSSHYSSPSAPHYIPYVETPAVPFGAYPNQYLANQMFHGHGERFVKLSSATKEARKKRMARQRTVFSHHRHQHNQPHQMAEQQQQQVQNSRLVNDSNCTTGHPNSVGKWVVWPTASSSSPPLISPDAILPSLDLNGMQQQPQFQRQVPSEKRQMWKPEKNLRFLLQKVLKQSDVGNLGRIVLPKKEAETHLPELDASDGISIPMEDIGTSRIWNMRYRFWPNNKSRMYLLENTGDFVRSNGLREGDFIVIYSDVKCGKYMIRGVKVRPTESKSEAKNPVKGQRKLHAMRDEPSSSRNTESLT